MEMISRVVILFSLLTACDQHSAVQHWTQVNAEDAESSFMLDPRSEPTDVPWGKTATSDYGLQNTANRILNAEANIAWVQYSRPNDDSPLGNDPTQALIKKLGKERAMQLLKRDSQRQYLEREELLKEVQTFVESDLAFYEVVALSFGIAASKKTYSSRAGNERAYYRVSFLSILESSNGRYENAAELQNFATTVQVAGVKRTTGYRTHYQPGVDSRSESKLKIGTLEVAASQYVLLPAGKRHQATLQVAEAGGSGRVFKDCFMTFDLPLDPSSTKILCERFKFPPLLKIRTNLPETKVDSVRYREAPLDGDCFASEDIGEGGLSQNAQMGFLLRGMDKCLGCHTKTSPDVEPYGGELFCPKKDGQSPDRLTYGNPKNSVIISHFIRNYFYDSRLEKVPREEKTMKDHLDVLKDAYCNENTFEIIEKGKAVTKGVRPLLEAWVKNYDNPNQLDFDLACKKAP